MPRPKLYLNGRRKMMLDEDLAVFLERVTQATHIPMTELLDEAVSDWMKRKGKSYLAGA